MQRILKSGTGWRLGWNPVAEPFKGLVGTEDWSLELTEAELHDFCRLIQQLADTIAAIQTELMDAETIACEVETNLLWLEAEGYPTAYSLHLILHTGRRAEGHWSADAVPELIEATRSLQVF
jgi:hypothetical protein